MTNATTLAPELSQTTPQMLDAAAEVYGEKKFIEEAGREISFVEFRRQCRQVAAALITKGFKTGDKAAIWAPNIHEWIIAALGTHYAGGVLVTINTRYKGSEAAHVIRSGKVTILFSIGHFLDQDYIQMLAEEDLPDLREIIIFNKAQQGQHTDWKEFVQSGEDLINQQGEQPIEQRAAEVTGDHLSDLLFTSGTTGAPKGVMTSHAQNIATFRIWTELLGLDDSDRYLVINPFFHSFGYKAGILACLMRGATLLPHQVFDTKAILSRIENENITMMPGPPTLFQSILADPEREQYDLSSLAKATTGAAVIPVELISRMHKDLGIDTVITAYGLTESCGLVTMCRRDDADEIIATTSGKAIPDVEVRCVDPLGNPVTAGEAGEIVVRGFNVMQGYFQDPKATSEAIDADGWLHTGDIGSLDGQGNLTITDRLKDMFITGGFNCYPAEIENCLNTHPDIAMSAVIGIADERQGEVAMAWVVRNAGPVAAGKAPDLTEEALIAWSRRHMANYKVPRVVRFVEALPMNASGKVLKTELRARLTEVTD